MLLVEDTQTEFNVGISVDLCFRYDYELLAHTFYVPYMTVHLLYYLKYKIFENWIFIMALTNSFFVLSMDLFSCIIHELISGSFHMMIWYDNMSYHNMKFYLILSCVNLIESDLTYKTIWMCTVYKCQPKKPQFLWISQWSTYLKQRNQVYFLTNICLF